MNQHEQTRLKQRIAQIAAAMIEGDMDYLEGALELLSLREEIGAYANDPDFIAFVAVASEVDSLPIGPSRKHWSKEALARHQTEIQESTEWAKEISLENCKSLARRFKV